MRVELGKEAEGLQFEREHQLSSRPLAMDLLIVKKRKETKIKKNIGRIFREHNIIEYKSPTDYLSINDFYKVYGYVYIYQSDTEEIGEIPPSEITITLISKNYPRDMIKYLEKHRGIRVSRQGDGIYYLKGDQFPIQVIVNKELSKEENYWLNALRDDLKSGGEIRDFISRYESEKSNKWCEDVADIIIRGNAEKVEEEKRKMCNALRELFREELEEAEEHGKRLGQETGERIGQEIGQQIGQQIGERTGKVLGKADSIIEILEMHGEVPEELKDRIMSQKDMGILSQWLKKAAKSESVEEFVEYLEA